MRRACLILGIGLVALALCAPTLARAENPHSPSSDTHQKEAQHQSDEAEQDLFGWALDLGIWTLVVFLVLLFVLSKFAWKPMMQGLEHREKAILSARQEAEQAREEAAQLRAQFEEQMRKANDQARELLDEARRAAERTTSEMVAEARKKIQAEHERIQHEMRLEHDQALRDIQTQAAQLATLVSSKVIRRHLNPDDHRQLVDESLAELRQADTGRQQPALV